MTQKKEEKLTIYEATTLLINKENRFEKDNSALVLKHFGALVEFSAQYTKVYNRVKATNEKGFNKALEIALKNEGDDFYQVVKKCTPNHKSAMRKLGKNPDQSVKVVEAKIKDCKDKKKPFKADTIRGLGSLLNVAPTEKTLDEVITDFFNSTTKKFDISTVKLVEAIANNQSKNNEEKSLDDQQVQQLHDIEVAKDMQLVASNS